MAAVGPWTDPYLSVALEGHLPAGVGGLSGKEGYVGRVSAGTVLVGSTATIAAANCIITWGPAVAGQIAGRHRGKVRAAVGNSGWAQDDPLTVDTDGRLITANPATTVTVAHALQDGIEGESAWIYWPPDNTQIAAAP